MIQTKERETGYVRVNGARIYYSVAGNGHPLVLLHAGIADSRMWEKQVDAFAERFQVITYDMRGFGRTEMPRGEFSHHHDLKGLLDHLLATKAYLLGVSMGGAVAINCYLEFPEYVDGLILVDSAVEGYVFKDSKTKEQWAEIDHALEHGQYEEAADLEIKMWVAGPKRSTDEVDPQILKLVREMLLPTYRIPPDRGAEKLVEPPAIDRLYDIRVPTMIIVGDQDVPDIQKISDILVSNIPAAEKIIIKGVAGLPNMEKPDKFNKVVLDFLSTRRF